MVKSSGEYSSWLASSSSLLQETVIIKINSDKIDNLKLFIK
ncbi:hypothetical protein Q4599_02345 [Cellulophaga lytica]|nr:hypothetical protein [Cellulophaga lytica]MDO6852402.1 hypothetical protein [Cellulophaga lytica]